MSDDASRRRETTGESGEQGYAFAEPGNGCWMPARGAHRPELLSQPGTWYGATIGPTAADSGLVMRLRDETSWALPTDPEERRAVVAEALARGLRWYGLQAGREIAARNPQLLAAYDHIHADELAEEDQS